ncbi:perlucin-like [Ochlerotatus camptorhynchus]|uniref:perlucin-like n=1 Tax=Ochlerotatus camptorhynchus TaxID=644619 RepID=UPI0031E01A8C
MQKWLVLFSFLGIAEVVRCGSYYIPDAVKDWFEAVEFCHELEMRLAVVDSAEKQHAIVEAIRSSDVFNPNRMDLWIGANDLDQEGRFVWQATGEGLGYTNWKPTMPDDHLLNEDCVHLHYTPFNDFQWNDYICYKKLYFVCEQ